MEEIKNIVKSLNIEEKKKELLISRKKLFNLKVQMSKLTFDRTVGLYGYYLDEMMYLILKSKNSSNTDIFNKIKKLETKAKELEIYDNVKEYGALRDEYFKTLDNSDYYKTINIDTMSSGYIVQLFSIFNGLEKFCFTISKYSECIPCKSKKVEYT